MAQVQWLFVSDTLTTGICYEVLKVKESLAVSVWGVMRWRVGDVDTDSIQMPTDVACLPQWGPTANTEYSQFILSKVNYNLMNIVYFPSQGRLYSH